MKEVRILFIGDMIGVPGMRAFISLLPALRKDHPHDVLVVNAENAAEGLGLTPELAQQLFNAGVNVITTGNHIWHHREILPHLDQMPNLLRPANYPSGNPGKGACLVEVKGVQVGIVNLQGRIRMWDIDCPLRKGREVVRKLRHDTKVILVDMHADAPAEKEALAWYLDGEVSAVAGTHTHVQTCDERILPKGTGFISDVGASGPDRSIIGFVAETGIQRNLTQIPIKSEVSPNPAWVRGVWLKVDAQSGRCLAIERLNRQSLV